MVYALWSSIYAPIKLEWKNTKKKSRESAIKKYIWCNCSMCRIVLSFAVCRVSCAVSGPTGQNIRLFVCCLGAKARTRKLYIDRKK